MKRIERYVPPNLKVGDAVWLLRGALLYEVTVSEVHVILQGEPHEFRMYSIKPDHDVYSYLSNDSQHRNDLFLRPAERKQLIEELESCIESLEYLAKDLKEEEEDEDR